jgi:class 3 adenylate cyclase
MLWRVAERDKLERAIAALEAQRTALGSSVVDTATAELRQKLAALKALTSDRRQLVTVLFADVSGFTALSERLDPEEVQGLLSRLWRRLDRAIVAQRGHIDKHIGDAVMAVWGLSETRADDAECAVRAALSMQAGLALFRTAEDVELGIRVGINSGLCSVSVVESTGEANLIGDTVNLASRLEHAAEVGSVLIGEATRDSVSASSSNSCLPWS